MRKLLLTLLTAGTALWAASAGTVRILDAAPGGGGAPVRQLALLQGLEKGSGEFRIETLPPEEALRQLEAGKADFVLVAESRIPDTFAGERRFYAALAAAVYLSTNNPAVTFTREQLASILTAERPEWTAYNGSPTEMHRLGLKPRANGAGVAEALIGLGKRKPAEGIFRVGSSRELLLLAGADSEAIAFGLLLPEVPVTVKTAAIDGVRPAPAEIAAGKYPLAVRCALLWKKNLSADAAEFLKRIDSKDFRDLVDEAEMLPLSR